MCEQANFRLDDLGWAERALLEVFSCGPELMDDLFFLNFVGLEIIGFGGVYKKLIGLIENEDITGDVVSEFESDYYC